MGWMGREWGVAGVWMAGVLGGSEVGFVVGRGGCDWVGEGEAARLEQKGQQNLASNIILYHIIL